MTDTDPTRGQIYTAQDITLHLSDVTAALRLEALDRAMARAVGCKPRMQMEMDTVSSDLDRLVVNPRRATGTGTTTPPPTTNLGMSTPRIESSGLGNGNGMGNGNGNGMPTQSRRSFALDPFTPAAFPATESLTVSLSNLAQGQPIRTLSNSSTAPQSLPLPSTSSIFDAYPSAPVFDQTSPFVTRPVGSVGGTSAGLFGAADVVATTSAGGANQDVQGGQSSGLMAAALKYFAVRSKEVDEGALAGAGADGTPMVQGTNLDVLLSRHLPQMLRIVCNFQHDTRVLILPGSVTFADVLAHLERKFRINNPVYMSVKYREVKGRTVFIADEEDWTVAKHLAKPDNELEIWCSMEQSAQIQPNRHG
ncbi:hypothetical protein BC936DRAFT_140163 [Jimgerdemannia flammicorona]|uniref:PB1 domain-containing protein n=1 Tax=Jimgerdemannia flammicorona TaxID=994334 RepID=A0A433AYL9_9FUNG|nr:hypothetical protein BC936DRAFT_140163 [Jimgerdemannia flammicorona]